VFPEGAVRHWTDATDAFWASAVADAGKTILIGAGQPIPGSTRSYNSLVIVGEHEKNAPQYSVDCTNASNSSLFMSCSTPRAPGTMKVLAHASMNTRLSRQGLFFNRERRASSIRVDTVLKLDRAAKRETSEDNHQEVPR
jgi:hypothetical protein